MSSNSKAIAGGQPHAETGFPQVEFDEERRDWKHPKKLKMRIKEFAPVIFILGLIALAGLMMTFPGWFGLPDSSGSPYLQ